MMKRFGSSLFIVFAVLMWSPRPALAVDSGGSEAAVSLVQGSAKVYLKGSAVGRLLHKGDRLKKDDEVKVAEKSRLEILFPDGTVMRLAEKSSLKMNELTFNKETDQKKVNVGLSIGKLWAKVKKLKTADSAVEVKTANAVAGVRGTVYRVNVKADKSALVKVYDGEVYVANPPRDATKPIDKTTAPHEVAGPHEVPPAYHEVSMEEWTAIVKAMQQISISSDGKPSEPEDFDPKADADDWVKWNQQRDKEMSL
jgi:hypothetical protein